MGMIVLMTPVHHASRYSGANARASTLAMKLISYKDVWLIRLVGRRDRYR